MTEGEKVFYGLELRKHRQLAKVAGDAETQQLHLRWIQFYENRLNGNRRAHAPDAYRHGVRAEGVSQAA